MNVIGPQPGVDRVADRLLRVFSIILENSTLCLLFNMRARCRFLIPYLPPKTVHFQYDDSYASEPCSPEHPRPAIIVISQCPPPAGTIAPIIIAIIMIIIGPTRRRSPFAHSRPIRQFHPWRAHEDQPFARRLEAAAEAQLAAANAT